MNIGPVPAPNQANDEYFRPKPPFWGPIRRVRDGTLQDVTAFEGAGEHPAACPVCAATATHGVAVIYGFPVYACADCGAGFVWPQPDDKFLVALYDDAMRNYIGGHEPVYMRPHLRRYVLRRQAEFLDRLVGGKKDLRVLDLGAGDGSMLRMLQDLGYRNLEGIDIDAESARRARDLLGVNVEARDFMTVHDRTWDVVCMWATIEHLKDPVGMLAHARTRLAPGGTMVAMTGDCASLAARLQGCFDTWVAPPGHLFFFDRPSLARAFARAGFRDVRTQKGFQRRAKEVFLETRRAVQAVAERWTPRKRPLWRSTTSNLIVGWARG